MIIYRLEERIAGRWEHLALCSTLERAQELGGVDFQAVTPIEWRQETLLPHRWIAEYAKQVLDMRYSTERRITPEAVDAHWITEVGSKQSVSES